jgi:hypothetical protein
LEGATASWDGVDPPNCEPAHGLGRGGDVVGAHADRVTSEQMLNRSDGVVTDVWIAGTPAWRGSLDPSCGDHSTKERIWVAGYDNVDWSCFIDRNIERALSGRHRLPVAMPAYR